MTEEINTHRSCKSKFSKVINTIIEECQTLENPHPEEYAKEMNENFSKLSLIYNQLNEKNFNPNNNQRFVLDKNKGAKLKAYLERKETERNSGNNFTDILQSSPTNSLTQKKDPYHFTFENIQATEISQILNNNKREFGKV